MQKIKSLCFSKSIIIFLIVALFLSFEKIGNAETISNIPSGIYIGRANYTKKVKPLDSSKSSELPNLKVFKETGLVFAAIVANGRVSGIITRRHLPKHVTSNGFADAFDFDYNALKENNWELAFDSDDSNKRIVRFSYDQVKNNLMFVDTSTYDTGVSISSHEVAVATANVIVNGSANLQANFNNDLEALYTNNQIKFAGLENVALKDCQSTTDFHDFINIASDGSVVGKVNSSPDTSNLGYTGLIFFGKLDPSGKFKTIYSNVTYGTSPVYALDKRPDFNPAIISLNISDININSNQIT